ncbi:hypothetical protein JOD69_000646 [Methylocaldum sp. RMAD-M]|jgi:hypothetical protein|nr:hypothetical protein [Methylocaldum sp. RMAD-M]
MIPDRALRVDHSRRPPFRSLQEAYRYRAINPLRQSPTGTGILTL